MAESEFQGFRLSPQQRRLWASQRVEGQSAYRVCGSVLLEGQVEPRVLREALHQTILRHEVLRTTYRTLPGMAVPLQVINDDPRYEFSVLDFSALPVAARNASVERVWQEVEAKVFDLATGPVLSASLLTLSPSEHRLQLCAPSLCTDEAGLMVVVREIALTYKSLINDEHEDTTPLQYADIAEVLNDLLESDETAAGRSYWQDVSYAEVKLPFDDDVEQGRSFLPQLLQFMLAASEVEKINDFARVHNTSPAVVLQACWQVLLWKITGQVEITVGTAFSGRVYEGLETVPGFFARYLPLSSQQQKQQPFRDVLDQLQRAASEAAEQQDYFDAERFAQRASSKSAHEFFFPVSFEYIESPLALELGGLRWTFQQHDGCIDRFLLKVRCVANERLRLEFHYDSARIAATTVDRLARNYRTLLSSSLQNQKARLGELEVLDDEQRHEILIDFNQTENPFPPPHLIHELIEKQCEQTPDACAIIFAQQQLTYSELDARANQLASHLRKREVGPETLVAILLDRSIEMIVGLLAVLKAGAAYLPLDPEQPPERLKTIIDNAKPKLVLTQEHLLSIATTVAHDSFDIICLDRDWESIATEPAFGIDSAALPENIAYVIYTSGSTGQPKGVAISHEAICNRLLWMQQRFPLTTSDRVLQKTVYSFDASVWELFLPLMTGAGLVLAEPGAHRDSAALVDAIKQAEVTVLQMVPSMLAVLVEEPGIAECRSLQRVFSGGEALAESLQERFYERLSWPELINLYGPTEAAIDVSYHVCERGRQRNKILIGRPISNVQLYVLDEEQQPVPVGTAGELYIGGVGLARGYWGQSRLTAERFVPNAVSGELGARLYRTGDLCRHLSDGTIEYLGRLDHQVKIRGFRIELGEIEAVLKQHPAVRQNVVIAREDPSGQKQLVAYIVANGSQVPRTTEWRQLLKEKLPDFMIPVAFEILEALPLTANGKLDRKRLPAPTQLSTDLEHTNVAPRTELQETLANIWAEVLKLERAGIHDNFFELGGDSIRSIQVKAAAQRVGVEFSLEQLFANQSVYTLARAIEATQPSALLPAQTAPFTLISSEDRSRMPAGIEDAYPLTMLQSGMLFHREYSPETAIYHDLTSFHLRGQLDLPALEKAIKELGVRHPILRTAFDLTSFSEPLQLVYATAEIPLEQIDLRSLSEAEQAETLKRWFEAQKLRVFDSARPPLLRFTMHRRGDDTLQFTMNCHHAILDGWSVAVMISELFQLYFVARGKTQALSIPPAATFRDFVALEKNALASQDCADYWLQKLSDHVVLKLPPRDDPQPPAAVHPFLHEVRLSDEISQNLRRLARRAGVPVKSVLLAAHLRVMSLVGGQRDVLTGVVTNCRLEEADGDRALGLFLNTVPFRQKLNGGDWIDLVRQTFATERELLPYRWFPLAEMQRRLGTGHLFETAFNFIHFHVYESVSRFEEMQPLSADTFEQTNHALTASFSLEIPSLRVNLGLLCDATQLDHAQVETIAGYYVKTLEAMASEPRGRYQTVLLMSESERQQLVVDWNQTSSDYELDQCLHERIEVQVATTPDAIAVICGDESLSYEELNQRANQLAHHLRALGVGAEVIVAVLMERSLELMVGLLAILKAGAAYVPLDPEQPPERLALILQSANPPVLLTQARFRERLRQDGMQTLCLDTDWQRFKSERVDNVRSGARPENVAYVIYTSGSTGQPKGVAISHEAICNRLLWMQQRFPLTASDRVLQKTVYSFDASVWELFLPLMTGASVVLAEPGAHRDSAALVDAIKQAEVTVLQMVPSMMAVLVEEPGIAQCRSLQRVFSGGEALAESLQDRFYERLSWAKLINLYGPTEAAIDVSYYVCERGRKRNKILIGRPISNVQLYVLDEEQQPVPVGTAGELNIGGIGLARGYWVQSRLTAERFVPNAISGELGARLYRTGDLCRYLSDGTIEYLGRLDHQVKIRGFRIELGEIEAAISKHPAVRDAVVLATDHNSGGKRLIAYVVSANHGSEASPEELRQALRDKLPDYMLPHAFIILDRLPLLANGKVNLSALPEPQDWLQDEENDYVAPRTPIEQVVAEIWANALQVEKVGLYDSFFELGGHSLLATQVISRIRQVFQIELPLRTLFDEPTVHGISRSIELARGAASEVFTKPIERVARDSALPVSFAQQRLWFLDKLETGTAAYNVACAVRLEGTLDVDALKQSFDAILARHEALRTTFTTIDGQAVQVIQPPQPVTLQIIDLEDLSDAERSVETRRLIDEEAAKPFDLRRGPLLRVLLLRSRADEHVMLLTMHHIVSDGWSLGVLVRELSALYAAFSGDESLELPELPIQYADFAAWQRNWLQGEVLESQLDYWRQHLADAPAVVELPTDQPRPLVQTYCGANHHSQIDSQTTQALRELSRREAASLFMTIVAAFDLLVSRHTGHDHIVLGTDVANRNREEVEGLIGFFANQLVLHTDLSGNPTFRELLARVRETTLGAYAHQDLPFEKLVEELRPGRDLSRTPLFQLKLVMQNAPLPAIELPALRLFSEEVSGGTAKFDLTLFVEETPDGLSCTWQYNSDLFILRTIERLAATFAQFLEQIVRAPDARLGELIDALNESEKKKLAAANFERFKAVKAKAVSQLS